jgi:hypothetical protein
MSSNSNIVELPADSVPDAIVSGELTFQEYIDARIDATASAEQRDETVDNLVANSTEYDESDRHALTNTPPRILDRLVADVPGASVTANTGDDDVDADDFGAGVIE